MLGDDGIQSQVGGVELCENRDKGQLGGADDQVWGWLEGQRYVEGMQLQQAEVQLCVALLLRVVH